MLLLESFGSLEHFFLLKRPLDGLGAVLEGPGIPHLKFKKMYTKSEKLDR